MSYHIPPPVRRRVEGYRWIRSDGKPNWNQKITSKISEALIIASKPPVTIPKDSNIMELVETIASKRVRGVPIVDSGQAITGVVTSMDVVNYLGGGTLFEIVAERHNYILYEALNKERISSLIYKRPLTATVDHRIDEILRLMVEHGIGFLPLVDSENIVKGVLTEHDLVKHLAEKTIGKTVAEVMSKVVIGIDLSDTLWNAMKLMVKHGFRRLLVFRDDKLEGMITAKDIVSFFGSHKAFDYVKSGDIRDVLNIPVKEIYTPVYQVASPMEDIGETASKMIKYGLSGLPVVENDVVVGIVTERDVLYGIVTR